MVLLGWESNTSILWQTSAKLEGGNLNLGVQVPHRLYMKHWIRVLLSLNFCVCTTKKFRS